MISNKQYFGLVLEPRFVDGCILPDGRIRFVDGVVMKRQDIGAKPVELNQDRPTNLRDVF